MMSTLATLAQFGPGRGGHDGGGLLALLLIPVILALVAYGVVLLMRGRSDGAVVVAAGPVAPSAARSILDERFARGEIDSDTYLHQVDTLRTADGPRPAVPQEAPTYEAPTTEVPPAQVPPAEVPTAEVPTTERNDDESPPVR